MLDSGGETGIRTLGGSFPPHSLSRLNRWYRACSIRPLTPSYFKHYKIYPNLNGPEKTGTIHKRGTIVGTISPQILILVMVADYGLDRNQVTVICIPVGLEKVGSNESKKWENLR